MKTKLILISILLFATASNSFAQSKFDSWPELKDFHKVMSATFHASEENNLEPIKTRATEMKEKAAALASSKIPAEFSNDKVKAATKELETGSVEMEKLVNGKASDKAITEHLFNLHETFHKIVGLCVPGTEPEHKE
jgi:hypothetical protein